MIDSKFIVKVIGTICMLVWGFSIVETWLVDPDKSRKFYQRHKGLAWVQILMCVLGVLYFFVCIALKRY